MRLGLTACPQLAILQAVGSMLLAVLLRHSVCSTTWHYIAVCMLLMTPLVRWMGTSLSPRHFVATLQDRGSRGLLAARCLSLWCACFALETWCRCKRCGVMACLLGVSILECAICRQLCMVVVWCVHCLWGDASSAWPVFVYVGRLPVVGPRFRYGITSSASWCCLLPAFWWPLHRHLSLTVHVEFALRNACCCVCLCVCGAAGVPSRRIFFADGE